MVMQCGSCNTTHFMRCINKSRQLAAQPKNYPITPIPNEPFFCPFMSTWPMLCEVPRRLQASSTSLLRACSGNAATAAKINTTNRGTDARHLPVAPYLSGKALRQVDQLAFCQPSDTDTPVPRRYRQPKKPRWRRVHTLLPRMTAEQSQQCGIAC